MDNAKLIIESGALALSAPVTFNDPFDCLPLWQDEDLHKAIDVLNGYMIDRAFFEHVKSNNNKKTIFYKINAKFIIWVYKIIKKSAKKSQGEYNPFFTPNILVKLLDIGIKLNDKNKNGLINAKNDFIQKMQELKEQEKNSLEQTFKIRDSIYVGCLSEKNDSILMWSYYGDKHRGVCIEFEVPEDKSHLFKVEYKSERPKIQSEKVIKEFCGRMLAQIDNELISQDEVIINLLALPYITKSIEWKHEYEYRYIFSEKELIEKGIEKIKTRDGVERYLYPMSDIKKLYFGANASLENKEKLQFVCENLNKNIKFENKIISDNKYLLLNEKLS